MSALGLALFAPLVAYVAISHSDEEGAHAKRHHEEVDQDLDENLGRPVPALERD